MILQNYIKRTAVAQQLRRQTHQVERVVAGGTEVGHPQTVILDSDMYNIIRHLLLS